MIGTAAAAASLTTNHSGPFSASVPASQGATDLNDLLREDLIEDDADIEPLSPARRRSTLSAFSQGMIEDMLSRLGVSHHDDEDEDELVKSNNETVEEAAASEMDLEGLLPSGKA